MSLTLNRMSQEELQQIEYESALLANSYINRFEEINLVGNQEYGKPEFTDEERF